jgi:hypothetical protein
MKVHLRLVGIALGVITFVGNLAAAEAVATGTVKSVDLGKREFILTDSMGKDRTVEYDEEMIVNRGGRDGQSELKTNDAICLYYEPGGLVWSANYILVQEGDTRNWSIGHGNVKSNETEKKEIAFIDDQGRKWTYSTDGVPVFVNRTKSKIESIKVGEHVMALQQKAGDRTTLKGLYITRK